MRTNENESLDLLNMDITNKIKGIAIILMIIHHCFGFPKWYVNGIDYSHISILGESLDYWITASTKICVSLYAFLTGYVYFYNKNKTLRYSIKKIMNLLLNYWVILFGLFIPISISLGTYKPTINTIILNMFALKGNLICFAWYVYFYIFIMLVLPLIIKKNNSLFDEIFMIVLCIFINNILAHIQITRGYLVTNFSNCLYYFQVVIIGYIFSKYNVFNRIKEYIGSINSIKLICIVLFILGSKLKWKTIIGLNLDIIYVPIMIFALINLLNDIKYRAIQVIFDFLGKHSLNIWFLHSIFFSSFTKGHIQQIAYLPRNPILVVVWVILLCIPMSLILNFIMKYVQCILNKIFI